MFFVGVFLHIVPLLPHYLPLATLNLLWPMPGRLAVLLSRAIVDFIDSFDLRCGILIVIGNGTYV